MIKSLVKPLPRKDLAMTKLIKVQLNLGINERNKFLFDFYYYFGSKLNMEFEGWLLDNYGLFRIFEKKETGWFED